MGLSVSYHRVAMTRAKEMPMRLVLAAIIACGAWAVTHSLWVIPYLVAVTAVQVVDLAITAGWRRDPDCQPSKLHEAAYLAWIFLNVVVYHGVTPLCWLQGGVAGHLFACLIPTAGLLNVALQGQAAPKITWAGCTPHAIVLMGLPISSIVMGQTESVVGMAFVAAGTALYTVHLAAAVRRIYKANSELAQAVADAQLERGRAEQANAAKSDFLATMSHEIRTPLNGVLGMTQAMANERLPKAQRARLDVIRQSGEVLLMLLNDLLDISKIEAAKLELSEGVLDLAELARQAEAAFAPLAAAKSVALSVETSSDIAGGWRADPTRVRQILYNLISNAVKFTDHGSVHAELELVDQAVTIRIADTGPGIAADRLEAVFERFIQADATSSRRFGGSGLGLAISRELARLMGGDITVKSVVGQGSTFTVTLPLPRSAAAAVEQAADEEPTMLDALRVLVAEDNETNRLVITTLLAQVGVTPAVAHDGADALAAWQTGGYDLILMDIQMPVMDGLSATRRIREIEAETGQMRTPIIALTANAMAHHVAEYTDAGFDGVAAKPIQFAQLLEAMDAALRPAAPQPHRASAAA